MQTITQMSQLSVLLKNLRKAKNLSQAELGAKVGLSQERISAMENHPERLTVDNFFTLLMALDAEFAVGPKATTLVESKTGNEISSADKRNIRNSIDTPYAPRNHPQDLSALVAQNSNTFERIRELNRKIEGFNKLPPGLSGQIQELVRKLDGINRLPPGLSEMIQRLKSQLPAVLPEKMQELASTAKNLRALATHQSPNAIEEERALDSLVKKLDEEAGNTTKPIDKSTHAGYTNSRTIDELAGNKKEPW